MIKVSLPLLSRAIVVKSLLICFSLFTQFTAASKVMKRLVVSLLAFIVTGHLMNGVSCNRACQWNGFGGCECNIFGACDVQGNPKPGLDIKTLGGHAPSGLEIFSKDASHNQSLAYLCESNTVAILYDCNKRIPLYAATVMGGSQLNGAGYKRPNIGFKRSNDRLLRPDYQQLDNDYLDSRKRTICYYSRKRPWPGSHQGPWLDNQWYRSLNPGKSIPVPFTNCNQVLLADKKVEVHKGHLIAAAYGRGYPARAAATFTYTNAVPQFGPFNSGQWMASEKKLVSWGQYHCATKNARNVSMYIIVGAIPSTYAYNGPAIERYFGSGGFSDFKDDRSFRVNVPSMMWSAACCTFQLQDTNGTWVEETRHTAFWRGNNPGKECCDTDITKLFGQHAIDLFPASKSCSDSKNFRLI